MDRNKVIAVNEDDVEVGVLNKLKAHQDGVLHRAISVFVFNTKNEWLIQQRAGNKYHSASLWSNSACSHPLQDESIQESAERRLEEEMGLQVQLKKIFSFQYKAEFENGLIENEIDHIYIGFSDANPDINLAEVSDFRWVKTNVLRKEIEDKPEDFTVWFKLLFPKVAEYFEKSGLEPHSSDN